MFHHRIDAETSSNKLTVHSVLKQHILLNHIQFNKQLPHGTSILYPSTPFTFKSKGLDCFFPTGSKNTSQSVHVLQFSRWEFQESKLRPLTLWPCVEFGTCIYIEICRYIIKSLNVQKIIYLYIHKIDMIYMYIYICAEVDHIPRHPVRRIYIARKVWHRHRHHQRGLFPNPGMFHKIGWQWDMSPVTRLSWRSIFPCTNLTQWSNTVDDSDMTSIIIKLSKPEKISMFTSNLPMEAFEQRFKRWEAGALRIWFLSSKAPQEVPVSNWLR